MSFHNQVLVINNYKALKSKMEDQLKKKLRKHSKQVKIESDKEPYKYFKHMELEHFEYWMTIFIRREFALEAQGDLLRILWRKAHGKEAKEIRKAIDFNFDRILRVQKWIKNLKRQALTDGVEMVELEVESPLSSDSETSFSFTTDDWSVEEDSRLMARYY